jgi:hypothetical protein
MRAAMPTVSHTRAQSNAWLSTRITSTFILELGLRSNKWRSRLAEILAIMYSTDEVQAIRTYTGGWGFSYTHY